MQSVPWHMVVCSLLCSCFLLSPIIPFIKAQSDEYAFCGTNGNYTQGSPYETNLKIVLSSLASNVSRNGYYNTTSGSTPNHVYGLVQCRADVSKEACATCGNASATDIVGKCPNQKEAQIYNDNCWLHYANNNFFSTASTSRVLLYNEQDASDANLFSGRVRPLMNNLTSKAASDPSKFAAGISGDVNGLVQCSRDLSSESCETCLQASIDAISDCCGSKRGARALSTTCFLRYELYSFFQLSPPPPPKTSSVADSPPNPFPTPPSVDSQTTNGGGKKNFVIPIVIPVAVLLVLICVLLFWRSGRRKNGVKEYWMKSTESLMFDLSSLRTATNNFSDSYKLGEGGFGSVYKGILPDGREIAVKRLSLKSTQGLKELKTEVVLVAKLLHRNLVRLLGFCLEEEEKLLVYEYLSNGSLDTFLFDQGKRLLLDWDKRYKIIVGIARGLLYLHEDSQLRIIHRDLKASNILLDEKMNPKISDFGLAKLFAESQAQANTNHIAGTYGYMSPEYIMNGHFSIKSDVFSFGVLVLEIVTGRKISSFRDGNLLSYAWQHWSEGTALEMVDATLRAQHMPTDMLKCIQLGLLCVQEDAIDRPTMSQVLLLLSTKNVTCPVPSRPAYFVKRVRTESDASKESSSVIMSAQSTNTFSLPSANEVTVSDIYPR